MELTLKVDGMKCGGCASHVEEALTRTAGVERVEVSLDEGRARLLVEDDVDPSVLVAAVREAGYEAAAR